MSDPQTIREHLEANDQLLGFALNAADVAAPLTLEEALKQARKHAVAALALLDKGKRRNEYGTRLGSGEFVCVLDPAPRGDAA